jgi:flavin reductase (DIM6/NTAB) family NADH-FMN oxidoreductase RutF
VAVDDRALPPVGVGMSSGERFDPLLLRAAFGSLATGVTVVTAVGVDGEPVGITANSVASVSLDPPLLLWCLANRSSSLGAFTDNAAFAVHVLAEGQRDIALHFARAQRAKFDIDPQWRANPHPPRVADVLARFECRVHALHAGGDHTIIVGRVTGLEQRLGSPLTFFGSRFGRFQGADTSVAANPWTDFRDAWL